MSLGELAARLDEPIAQVRAWRDAGLISAATAETFGHEDLARARLVQTLLARGLDVAALARSTREGWLAAHMDEYLDQRFPGEGRPARSLAEVAAEIGLDRAVAERMWHAAGAGVVDDVVNAEDEGFLGTAQFALAAGVPEEALLQLVRVWSDTLGRAAESASRVMHFYIHEAAAAKPPLDTAAVVGDLGPLLEPTILYFLHRRTADAMPGDFAMHIAEELGERGPSDVPGQLDAAIVFVDLAGFTPLTEAMGDAEAADVLRRFADLVREAARRHGGQIVKQIGDAFMVLFHEPRGAVRFAIELEGRAAAEPRFPALRAGMHWGPVLYREGDYVGATVNVAARVAADADRHDVLVTAAVRDAVGDEPDVCFTALPKRRLKGVADDVALYAVCPEAARPEGRVDPVCGMELRDADVAATLTVGGRTHAFCSEDCLRLFAAAPERYPSPD